MSNSEVVIVPVDEDPDRCRDNTDVAYVDEDPYPYRNTAVQGRESSEILGTLNRNIAVQGETESSEILATSKLEEEDKQELSFNPPLYKQRYHHVLDVLKRFRPTKVVDFGCSECRFLRLAKSQDYIENLIGVDIDVGVLDSNAYLIQPLICDYITKRDRPLRISLFRGSVADTDHRMSGTDAVVAIELVEHLYPDVLARFETNIFGFIRPRLVVVTTPNSDFNVLFPGMRSLFRHWDHKFEWSRDEFKRWCDRISLGYGYSVSYDGVGEPHEGSLHVGFCSQIAVFLIKPAQDYVTSVQASQLTPYERVAYSDYPVRKRLTEKEELYDSLYHVLRHQLLCSDDGHMWYDILQLLAEHSCLSRWSCKLDQFRGLVTQFSEDFVLSSDLNEISLKCRDESADSCDGDTDAGSDCGFVDYVCETWE